jgi:hypothetical protein
MNPYQFHIITLMGPMIGVMVSQDILMAHQRQAHFEMGCVKGFAGSLMTSNLLSHSSQYRQP